MATAPELHTASSQKPMVEELSCSASASTPNCSKEFLPDAIRASSKAHDSASVPGSNSSPVSANPRSFQPPPRSSPKQSSNGVSSTSYVTAPDHDTKTTNYPAAPAMHQKHSHKTIQDHLQKEEVPSSLKKSHKSNRGQPLPVDIKDSKMAGATTQEEVLTETNPEPEPCIKNHIDDSKTPKSTCLPKQEGFVSGPCEDPDNSSLAPQSGINRYPSPDNNFCTEAQYIEAKESFAATDVSDRVSSVEKSGGSAKASNSCDFVESRKTSICRGSTGSDVSDESSSSSMSSAVYKPHKGNDRRWEAIQAVRSRDGVLGLNHFRLLRRLGCGDIGSVYLSELTGTRSLFAMKVMDKAALASRKKLLRAQTEREILQSLDHPFLPTLYTHFETEKFSCLVMEFCPGGDLHALRQRQPGKYFPEHAARFYVAEVLLALEYLHMLGIIYRDLKPENVLVREDGHIMLSDFDLSLRCAVCPTLVRSTNTNMDSAKNSGYCVQPSCIEPTCMIQPSCIQPTCFAPRFLSRKPKKEKKSKPKNEVYNQVSPLPELIAEPTNARSMSFVGTHEYLAPEIIKGEGHGSAVDWWTFGIFLYELLFGKTPFKGSGNRATLFNVVGQPLRFPESPTVSFAARDLIRGLLVKEPQHRLAYRRGATEVKQHPFFQSVNWALIRCASPPDVPKPFVMDFPTRTEVPKAPTNERMPGVDVKPSGNYLEIDFF